MLFFLEQTNKQGKLDFFFRDEGSIFQLIRFQLSQEIAAHAG